MRALFAFLTEHLDTLPTAKIYLAEQVTPCYRKLKLRYPNLVGSEYIEPNRSPGTEIQLKEQIIRHEDITNLSFADANFDVVVTQDVFEHIADYKEAFLQCHRVLAPKGYMVFTIPFFPHQKDTEARATVSPNGIIQHHCRRSRVMQHCNKRINYKYSMGPPGVKERGECAKIRKSSRG